MLLNPRLCLLAGFAALVAGSGPMMQPNDIRSAFALDLPKGFVVVKRPTAVEDFEVFEVRCGKVPYVGIYAGNAPDFDRDQRDGTQRLLKTKYDWPQYLHVWVYDLPPGRRRKAEEIAASVRAN